MKALNVGSVFFFTMALPFLFSLPAESTPALSVSPADTTVTRGASFDLRVAVNGDFNDLMGYNVTVRIDSSVIRIQSVEEGSLLLSSGHPAFFCWSNQETAYDSVLVNGAILGGTIDGPGTLFVMRLVAAGCGLSNVRISASELRNGLNSSIDHIIEPGIVRVAGPTDVDFITWGSLKRKF